MNARSATPDHPRRAVYARPDHVPLFWRINLFGAPLAWWFLPAVMRRHIHWHTHGRVTRVLYRAIEQAADGDHVTVRLLYWSDYRKAWDMLTRRGYLLQPRVGGGSLWRIPCTGPIDSPDEYGTIDMEMCDDCCGANGIAMISGW